MSDRVRGRDDKDVRIGRKGRMDCMGRGSEGGNRGRDGDGTCVEHATRLQPRDANIREKPLAIGPGSAGSSRLNPLEKRPKPGSKTHEVDSFEVAGANLRVACSIIQS